MAAPDNNPGNSFMYDPDINTTHQLCLGIDRSNDAGIWSCTFRNDQAWYRGAEKGTTSYYQYKNALGKCLGVLGGSTAAGAKVVGWTCNGHNDQYWNVDFLSTQTYACWVFNYNSGYVLEPARNASGALVKQQPWDGATDQEWVFEINS